MITESFIDGTSVPSPQQYDNIDPATGRVIGTVVEENNGDKTIKDFYGRPLGYYKKGRNVTTDFYGRVVASGDQLTMLLNSDK